MHGWKELLLHPQRQKNPWQVSAGEEQEEVPKPSINLHLLCPEPNNQLCTIKPINLIFFFHIPSAQSLFSLRHNQLRHFTALRPEFHRLYDTAVKIWLLHIILETFDNMISCFCIVGIFPRRTPDRRFGRTDAAAVWLPAGLQQKFSKEKMRMWLQIVPVHPNWWAVLHQNPNKDTFCLTKSRSDQTPVRSKLKHKSCLKAVKVQKKP